MWAVAAIAAVSALVQWMNSEDARRASAKERAKIARMVDKLQSPNFTQSDFTPEEFKLLGRYTPEVAQNVLEKAPKTVDDTSAMGTGRSAQLDALHQMRSTAMQERDPALAAALEQASRRGAIDAQSRQQSLLNNFERRGQGGGSAQLVAQMQGSGDAMERSAEAGRASAIESYRNRQTAMRDSANLGGNIWSQDFQKERGNVDIINDFNQRMSAQQNNYNRYAADTRNDAQKYNLGAERGAYEKNFDARQNAQDKWQNARQTNYQNQANQVGLKTGQGQANIQAINQNAQDKNQMVQGIANAGTAMYKNSQQNEAYNRMEDGADRRQIFNRTGQWMTPDEYQKWQLSKQQELQMKPVEYSDQLDERYRTA